MELSVYHHAKTPERFCCQISGGEIRFEPLLDSNDGKWISESIFAALKNKPVAQAA